MNVTTAGQNCLAVETVEPQTTADDGGSTFELVCGRESNHLHPPVAGRDLGGSPSSDADHHVPILDKPPQNKRQDEQQGDTGYVSQQQSCSTAPNKEDCVKTVSVCTINSCTADEGAELVAGCVVFHRVVRPPVGVHAGPLPRCLLPVVQKLAVAEAGDRAASAVEK